MSRAAGDEAPTGAARGAARRTSVWAIVAMLCSAAIFCPLLTLIGPLIAIRALVEIRRGEAVRGQGFALAAIAIGLLATVGWVYGAYWWDRHARAPMLAGPQAALHAGFAGDVAGFRDDFCCEAAAAPDLEAIAFINELRRRYGEFVESAGLPDRQPEGSALDPAGVGIWYRLRFERAEVDARAVFHVWADGQSGLVLKFSSVAVVDPQRGELVFPASRAAGPTAVIPPPSLPADSPQ
ncbi:MAG: hypothetical protein ACYSXF_09895 [Planctomycetota bacterium]|jgi:hypothetical protein